MVNRYLYQDISTGEWYFRGKWYPEYPAMLIEDYENKCLEAWEMREEERRLNDYENR